MTARLISFGHTAVTVEAGDARAQAVVDFLFRFTASDADCLPYTTFRIATDPASGKLGVYRDGALLRESASDADLAEYLLGEVTFRLLDQSRDGITLHAGALAWRDKGILIPGAIGAGKTTLTAWLVHQGLDYLTDEMVWVATGTDQLDAFTRPLNVKPAGRAILQTFFDFEAQASHVLRGELVDLILPTALNPTNVLSTPSLGLILFPAYQPNVAPQIEYLSSAQTGLALASGILNVGNLSDRGFAQIAHLARVAPAFRVRYSHFDQIEKQLQTLIGFGD